MWKPGSPMPSTAGTKRPRPTASAVAAVEPPPVPANNCSPKPAAARQLSGATKNMRFMKRGLQRRSSDEVQSKSNVQKKRDDTTVRVVLPDEPDDAFTLTTTTPAGGRPSQGGEAQQSLHHETNDSDKSSDEDMVDSPDAFPSAALVLPVQQATPQDMYGWEQSQVLGRRSFGGFQPVTAENWYHQQQAHKAASGVKHLPSDEELLRLHSNSRSRLGKKQPPHDQQRNQRNKKLKQISGAGGKNTKSAAERREKLMDELMME